MSVCVDWKISWHKPNKDTFSIEETENIEKIICSRMVDCGDLSGNSAAFTTDSHFARDGFVEEFSEYTKKYPDVAVEAEYRYEYKMVPDKMVFFHGESRFFRGIVVYEEVD